MSTNKTPTYKTLEEQYRAISPFMQNRELSWLTFDERVLDQGADESVPLLERLNFVSIFWSNLQEFFMVRVGSLTDLSLLKTPVIDTKSGLSSSEQIKVIHERCHQLYPQQEKVFEDIRSQLAEKGVHQLHFNELDKDQLEYIADYGQEFIKPFLSPQIVNSRHPFPHLENGDLYVVVRLDDLSSDKKKKKKKKDKAGGAEGVTLGLIPMPRQCRRVIEIPGEETTFILLEEVVEQLAESVFDMYKVKQTNIVCVTRNADLDTTESSDEADADYREHMKRILKKRGRLAPVRLESAKPLSSVVKETMLARLGLEEYQTYVTSVPLDLSYTWGISGMLNKEQRTPLVNTPFNPTLCARVKPGKSLIKQVTKKDLLLCYPYESMDSFVQLLEEAAIDPSVVSIRITLYRLASVSRLAEALIRAAENGKDVTALFELRARFDEDNNIKWSQRFEESGCNVIYGFRDFKVHSKICSITRETENGIQYITQLGTGNYNEKTARLYTDISYITTNPAFGKDAVRFFRNMALENADDDYKTLWVAPLQIKPNVLAGIDGEIAKAKKGKPCGLFFKTNSITDKDVIEKIAKASQAGVPVVLFVRGISCIVPGVPGYTDNVRVVSIVGRLLEHSRIYCFGAVDDPEMRLYCSSADLMTRNMDKRVEIAWPITEERHRQRIMDYLFASLCDTAKLRELQPDGTYTPIGHFAESDEELFDSQKFEIEVAKLPTSEQKDLVKALRKNHKKAVGEKVVEEPEAETEVAPVAEIEPEPEIAPEPVAEAAPVKSAAPRKAAAKATGRANNGAVRPASLKKPEIEPEVKVEVAEVAPEPVAETAPVKSAAPRKAAAKATGRANNGAVRPASLKKPAAVSVVAAAVVAAVASEPIAETVKSAAPRKAAAKATGRASNGAVRPAGLKKPEAESEAEVELAPEPVTEVIPVKSAAPRKAARETTGRASNGAVRPASLKKPEIEPEAKVEVAEVAPEPEAAPVKSAAPRKAAAKATGHASNGAVRPASLKKPEAEPEAEVELAPEPVAEAAPVKSAAPRKAAGETTGRASNGAVRPASLKKPAADPEPEAEPEPETKPEPEPISEEAPAPEPVKPEPKPQAAPPSPATASNRDQIASRIGRGIATTAFKGLASVSSLRKKLRGR